MRYCCDEDCNQGRNCPVRVAKVGQRYPKHPKPVVRYAKHQLKLLAKWMLLALIGWLCFGLIAVAAIGYLGHAS